MEPELLCDYQCVTGEGPLWHPDEQCVYWVDIPAGRLFRFDPATGAHSEIYRGDVIGGFTIQADGALLLFGERGTVRRWRDGKTTVVIETIDGEETGRFNDVIADPAGRVFCGTMPGENQLARLFRLDPDGTITTVLEGIGLSNGMGFSPDRSAFYFTDSNNYVIYRFDYDESSGNIDNQRIFARVDPADGIPDGMTVDAGGYVWSARWNGSRIVRYTPNGELEREIVFPARQVSSVSFGGPDYSDLYVTTAGGDNKEENGPQAGALFRLRIEGIRGVAEYRSRVRVPGHDGTRADSSTRNPRAG